MTIPFNHTANEAELLARPEVRDRAQMLINHRDQWAQLAMERGARLDEIADVLRRFAASAVSLSSLQAVLDLAADMNPDLTDPRRI